MSHLLEPPIVLKGELSKADVLTAERMLTTKRSKVVKASAYLTLIALALGVGISLREYDENVSDWIFLGTFVVLSALLLVPFLLTRYRVHWAWVRKVGIFDCAETTISNDGLVMKLPHAISNIEWAMFFAAMIRPRAIILFYPGAWMLFARSRFADDHEWNRFTAYVQQNIEQVHEL